MKILLIVTLVFINSLFAQYDFNDKNSGKIDMHGGKGEKLIDNKNSLTNKEFNKIGIISPIAPKAPQKLIKDDVKKEDKKK